MKELNYMRITFDLRNVGLGNNGGSFTLIKSGNTLVDMGHEVVFIDSGKNQHTWVDLKAKHKIVRDRDGIPNADFIIATGYKSVSETLAAPYHAGVKCHWLRGWEIWQGNEKWIVEKIIKAPTLKLVNGIGLQKKLQQFGAKSHLVRPGYDFNNFKRLNIRNKKDYVVIGGLNKQGKHANIKRTAWIIETVKVLKRKYGEKIKLWMFGMDSLPATTAVDYYVKNPTNEEKNRIYNTVDIWLATSMLEGLHMPPAEAMITECAVVGTNAELSGTEDYLIHNETGIVSNNDIISFMKAVEKLVFNSNERLKFGKNGRHKIQSIGSREKNMQVLIDIFSDYKDW
jgi:glycosyltransferase involved in cell wall biosynthesis